MQKKYTLKNIVGAQYFNDIRDEAACEISGAKVTCNSEKHYFLLDAPNDKFDAFKDKLFAIIRKYLPACEIEESNDVPLYRRIVYLDNLHCANCAERIEREAKKAFDYERLNVDFAGSRLIIETRDGTLIDNLENEVKKITSVIDTNIVPHMQKSLKKKFLAKSSGKEGITKKVLAAIGFAVFLLTLTVQYLVFPYVFDGYDTKIYLNSEFIVQDTVLVGCYLLAYCFLGYDLLHRAFGNLKSGHVFDENFLMVLATVLAFLIGSFSEAVLVLLFYKFGEFLQDYAVDKSKTSINALIDIKPETATIIVNDTEVVVDPSEVKKNDIIIVKPGEKIPLDGVIVAGDAFLDTSLLTGESKFAEAKTNDVVMSGAVNVDGYLKIRVTHLYSESTVAKVIDMVNNARLNKSKTENFVGKFAGIYTPVVCVSALVIMILNFLVFKKNMAGQNVYEYIHASIYPAIIFLIVSCPCAIVLSVPLSFFGGIGSSSKRGILIKGSNFLEDLGNLGLVVFDKTGTLTKGQFAIEEIKAQGFTQAQVLRYAAHCEAGSIHPIAKSIVDAYGYKNIDFDLISYLPSPSKRGNIIRLGKEEVVVGNGQFMKELKIKVPIVKSTGLVVYVVVEGKYIGSIVLKDEIREESRKTVSYLKQAGLDVVMVTGDEEVIARDVANELGIEKIYANMMPLDKVRRVDKLKKHYPKKKIVFVGDGINDAPALARADIGIAMGGLGSDAAIGVSDVVLMTDDLSKLIEVLGIAKKVKKVVLQNIVFTLIVKIIVLTSAVFFPKYTFMFEGIFADVGVSLIAVINSMRTMNISRKAIFKLLFSKKQDECDDVSRG